MQTLETIAQRASVREYQDKPVDKMVLEKLVDAGRRAPSARHVEPWIFIALTQKEVLKKLGQLAPNGSFLSQAAAGIIVFCEETKYYLEDGCAATENILLAAADLGLGACWVAGDKKDYASEVAHIFGVPSKYKLVSMIALGWPKQPVLQKKYKELQQVLYWEEYS
jgi:nitroreductase